MSSQPINQRVALVTGAGRNIGREIALSLAVAGIAVAVNIRASVKEGQSVVDEIIKRGGKALLCIADVTDRDAVAQMVAGIDRRLRGGGLPAIRAGLSRSASP